MSARMDSAIECACDELDAHQTVEMLVRGLLIEPRNQVILAHRLALDAHLARLDTLRAIATAKEQA
jgi:hypothetical protein